VNHVTLTGRVTRDPETKWLGREKNFPVLTLNLAVDDAEGRWDPETKRSTVGSGFYRVELAGDLARQFGRLEKGEEIWIQGSLAQFMAGEGDEKQPRTFVKAKVCISLSVDDRVDQPVQTQAGWDDGEEPF
jgi:single-stranded DNA-binding protein